MYTKMPTKEFVDPLKALDAKFKPIKIGVSKGPVFTNLFTMRPLISKIQYRMFSHFKKNGFEVLPTCILKLHMGFWNCDLCQLLTF